MDRSQTAIGTPRSDPTDHRSKALDSDARPSTLPGRPQRVPGPSRRFPERTVAKHVLRRGHTYYFRARHFLARRGAPTHMCVSLRTRDHDEALRRATRLEGVMAEMQKQAAQRLVEPGMIAECLRGAVATFDDPGLLPTDQERLARLTRERCDHANEVRLAKSNRLCDWADGNVPSAATDADVMETYADEYRKALAMGDLAIGLRAVPRYVNALNIPDPTPLTSSMMARVILRE